MDNLIQFNDLKIGDKFYFIRDENKNTCIKTRTKDIEIGYGTYKYSKCPMAYACNYGCPEYVADINDLCATIENVVATD